MCRLISWLSYCELLRPHANAWIVTFASFIINFWICVQRFPGVAAESHVLCITCENHFRDNLESHVIPGFCYSPADETCDIAVSKWFCGFNMRMINMRKSMLIQGQRRKFNGIADASFFAALIYGAVGSRRLSTGFAAATNTTNVFFIHTYRSRHALLGYFRLCQFKSQSGTWSSARCGETNRAFSRGLEKRGQGCACVCVYVCTCYVYVCVKEIEERKREREGGKRERRTVSRKKSVWRLLHVNCTSSGALVDSIPGTCWSAIHMTVPCCLIIPPQARRRDSRPRETVSVGKCFSRMRGAPPPLWTRVI